MAYVYFNNNPKNQRVGDCAVRAVSKALGKSWDDTYIGLCAEGLFYHDMPSSNYVWGMYLRKHGFVQKAIPSICPQCVTVGQFANEHPTGVYVCATQGHVVCIDSGSEPIPSVESTREIMVSDNGGSEFLRAIHGKDAYSMWQIMDEVMDTIKAFQPRLYDATLQKIKE